MRTLYLWGVMKAVCIPDAICGNVEGAKGPENPEISVMVVSAMTTVQALREKATGLFLVSTVERHGLVDSDQLISLQQEDPAIQGLVFAKKTARKGTKTASFEKIKDILYR
ncbi:hypothetical protein PoB_007417600 [Plakobranchus ocellatus]|uniref:Uncharacterized protein n=1 Tax=Plakobranchus ocellatus TaxID=259542 RepID=A0AAV4DV14_9GAST|nr:hypothetical protein PoB_007417600 [Plakobranchus ocellatus]